MVANLIKTFSSESNARSTWESLARRSEPGETYLETRGLWPEALIAGGYVRFMQTGAPAVALRHLVYGSAIVNVVRRNMPVDVEAGRPKVHGMYGAPTSGVLIGNVDEIGDERRDAVVCEGVIDSLAALLAWPTRVVCGAHGAGRLAEIAAEVSARCVSAGTSMTLVCDDDPAGAKAGARAILAAQSAGLVLDRDLHIADLGGAHDLADAWAEGWRP